MKWFVKQFAGKWVRRCPYCNKITAHDTEPSTSWTCTCKAICNPETYKRLQKLSRAMMRGDANTPIREWLTLRIKKEVRKMTPNPDINKGTPLPMPVCCNICGKWFVNAKAAVNHAYKHCEKLEEAIT